MQQVPQGIFCLLLIPDFLPGSPINEPSVIVNTKGLNELSIIGSGLTDVLGIEGKGPGHLLKVLKDCPHPQFQSLCHLWTSHSGDEPFCQRLPRPDEGRHPGRLVIFIQPSLDDWAQTRHVQTLKFNDRTGKARATELLQHLGGKLQPCDMTGRSSGALRTIHDPLLVLKEDVLKLKIVSHKS